MQNLQGWLRMLAENLDWVEQVDMTNPADVTRVLMIRAQMLSVAERLTQVAGEIPGRYSKEEFIQTLQERT